MLKKTVNYLIIVIVNIIVLTALLALWTDKLELLFNEWVRPREFIKIIAFSLVSLIAIRIVVGIFRKRNITKRSLKLKISAFLTFLIFSYLYIDYSTRIISNVFINREFRNQIAKKIKPFNELANGTQGSNLTIKEYQQITKMCWLPKLPDEASNIQYSYGHDQFLPDYSFTVTYDLPIQNEVDTINYRKGDFSKYQSFVVIGNIKKVTYSESEQ